MIDTQWKPVAAPGNEPIAWYLDIPTQYAEFDKRGHVLRYLAGILPLPYTTLMITRRNERGGDVPAAYRSQVFEITQGATDERQAA